MPCCLNNSVQEKTVNVTSGWRAIGDGGDSREPPPVGINGSKDYFCAVVAGAAGAASAAGA